MDVVAVGVVEVDLNDGKAGNRVDGIRDVAGFQTVGEFVDIRGTKRGVFNGG